MAVEDLARFEGEADLVGAERAGAAVVEVEGEPATGVLPRGFPSVTLPFSVAARRPAHRFPMAVGRLDG